MRAFVINAFKRLYPPSRLRDSHIGTHDAEPANLIPPLQAKRCGGGGLRRPPVCAKRSRRINSATQDGGGNSAILPISRPLHRLRRSPSPAAQGRKHGEGRKLFLLRSAPLALLFLAGCTVGPDFVPPKAETPAKWTQTGSPQKGKSVPVAAEPANDAWWQSFGDPELTSLIVRAGSANLDLKEAALRIAEARLQEKITAAGELPTLDANASYSSTRFSTSTAQGSLFNALGSFKLPQGLSNLSFPNPYNQFQTGFDASWEPDLFGGIKRSEEAGAAQTEAAVEERNAALVSLEGEIARDYMDLRGTQLKRAITTDNIKTERETLMLTRERLNAKLGTELDVDNAAAQVASTQSQLPPLDSEIASDINQLSLLLAREPGALRAELAIKRAVPPPPPEIPIGLPGDLARRRPDIREAEANLHAAAARVGVAVAQLYPSVTFNASLGTQAEQFPQLASWASRFFQVGPSIDIPIFEGGRLRATVHLQEAQEKEAAIDYAKTVLSAVHDVENALVAYSAEQERRRSLEETESENRRALALARQRYHDGITTFLDVLDAERTLLQTELTLTDSTQSVSTDLVAVYKALGGGWQIKQ
jgi:outer membrane protein, multidrug efflux system